MKHLIYRVSLMNTRVAQLKRVFPLLLLLFENVRGEKNALEVIHSLARALCPNTEVEEGVEGRKEVLLGILDL